MIIWRILEKSFRILNWQKCPKIEIYFFWFFWFLLFNDKLILLYSIFLQNCWWITRFIFKVYIFFFFYVLYWNEFLWMNFIRNFLWFRFLDILWFCSLLWYLIIGSPSINCLFLIWFFFYCQEHIRILNFAFLYNLFTFLLIFFFLNMLFLWAINQFRFNFGPIPQNLFFSTNKQFINSHIFHSTNIIKILLSTTFLFELNLF